MLVGATAIGRDLGPRVSARVQTGLTADCTVLEIGDFPLRAIPGKEQKHNQLLMTRPAFGGNTIATIACPDNRPQMATVRPGVMQKIDPIEGAKAEVIEYNPGFTPDNKYVEIMDIVKSVTDTVDIMDAKILVSGGRGVGEEGFGMLKELAEVLGGEVSCSRALLITDGSQEISRLDRQEKLYVLMYTSQLVFLEQSSTLQVWKNLISSLQSTKMKQLLSLM